MSDQIKHPSYASKGDLTKGDIQKHLIRLSLPMTWGIFAIISFQLVDMYYISRLGTQELAAISFTFPVTYTVFSLILGFGIAMSSVLSRQIGEGNQEKVRRIATHGLVFSFLFGVVLAISGMFLSAPIFRMMGAGDAMMPLIMDYIWIWFAGSVFINMPMVGNAAIRATGDTKVPALIMTVVAVVNIILDPILIFGLFGFPRMEMQGAALATVIANACAMFAGLYILYFHKKLIFQPGIGVRHFWDSVKRLVFIAVPVGLTSIIQPITNAVIIALLADFGAEAVAAYGVVSRMEAFAFIVIMALATGMAPIIGQNWGAALYNRVDETLRKAIGFACLWSLLVALVFILLGRPLAGIFAEEEAYIDVAVTYFLIVAITYIPGNLVPGWSSAFNAMGKPQRSFMMIAVKMFVLQIPLAFLFGHYFGVTGIFCAIATTNVISGIGFHLMNRRICERARAAASDRDMKLEGQEAVK